MSKYTPGPWYYDGPSMNTDAHIIHVAEGEVAEVFEEWNDRKTAISNASLIAAAPELLEACKVALEAIIRNQAYHCDVSLAKEQIKAAIAKAENA